MRWVIIIGAVAIASIYSGTLIWCVLAIRTATRIAAEVLDIHTNKLREQSAEIKTLRESSFPQYRGAVSALPDPQWIAHDDRVTAALAAPLVERAAPHKLAQNAAYGPWQVDVVSAYPTEALEALDPHARRKHAGEGLPNPDDAPFFTQSAPEK